MILKKKLSTTGNNKCLILNKFIVEALGLKNRVKLTISDSKIIIEKD
jgi:hypothetical protein